MTEQQEREAFEAWAIALGLATARGNATGNPEGYYYGTTDRAWSAWQARASLTPPAPAPEATPADSEPVEMSPDYTDGARAALLWVLWHHQGGSSPVGQPIRYALGMGAHEPLSESQVTEAKRWAAVFGVTTAEFHAYRGAATPSQAQQAEPIAEHLKKHLPTYASKHPSLLVRQLATALMAATKAEAKPLTDEQIEQGRHATFSTGNPFCPCDSKTMRKAVRWAERACAEAWGVKLAGQWKEAGNG